MTKNTLLIFEAPSEQRLKCANQLKPIYNVALRRHPYGQRANSILRNCNDLWNKAKNLYRRCGRDWKMCWRYAFGAACYKTNAHSSAYCVYCVCTVRTCIVVYGEAKTIY